MGVVCYMHLSANERLPRIEGDKPFKAVVIIEQDVQSSWRNAASGWLVDSGCLYMMAWGLDCEQWDESVDWACVGPDGMDNRFVMTTWHANETLEDVFVFSKNCAETQVECQQVLLIHISDKNREDEILSLYEAAS